MSPPLPERPGPRIARRVDRSRTPGNACAVSSPSGGDDCDDDPRPQGDGLALPVAATTPELAAVALAAGLVGGLAPDLDLYAGHRKTLHLPVYGPIAAVPALALAAVAPSAATIALTVGLAVAALHAVAGTLVGISTGTSRTYGSRIPSSRPTRPSACRPRSRSRVRTTPGRSSRRPRRRRAVPGTTR